jgi:pimeloyl-ACP methyl ester carboxylesterase
MERCAIVSGIEAITLTNGQLRFSAEAAGAGPVVLFLHGFPDSNASFAAQLPAFAKAGYRAVAATMRGYAPEAQPEDGDYHAIRMAEDVAAWIEQLDADEVHLVGHDWGASIAYAAAALVPQRIRSLTTIAVPHPVRFGEAFAVNPAQQARSAYIMEFQQPGFEDRIVSDDCAYLEALWRSWSPEWVIPAAMLTDMKSVFIQPGVARAALEYYRQAFDAASPAALETQALFAKPITVPTLAICGEADGCIAADIFIGAMRAEDFPSELRVEQVIGAGHFVHIEQPEVVNDLILGWIRSHSG